MTSTSSRRARPSIVGVGGTVLSDAGAVQIVDPTAQDDAHPPRARALSTAEIVDLIVDVADFPMGNAPVDEPPHAQAVPRLLALIDSLAVRIGSNE